MASAAITFSSGSTPRNSLAAIVSTSVSTSTGTSPVQNFDHRKSRSEIGDVRMIQNAAPSADTAGNTNRTATVAITSPAMPEVDERVDVLEEAAHVRDALQIEHAEVVEIQQHQREQQQQLRPLADVAQEDLQVLDQQLAADRATAAARRR